MIIFLHSYNPTIKFQSVTVIVNKGYNIFIQELISQGITRIAVPLFFVISGYLFSLNINDGFSEYKLKLKKRIKSLVLPYLLWSMFGIVLYFVLQSIPFSKPFFTNELIIDNSTNELISKIFIYPIAHQLWFIRDLILLVIFYPLLFWLIKQFNFYVITILLITWFYNFNYLILENESLLFFAFGILLSKSKINIEKIKKANYLNFLFNIIWILLVLIKTYLVYINSENEWFIRILHKSSILIGIISIWLLYDLIFRKVDILGSKFYLLFQYTFFLYAFHEPLLTIFKKLLFYILGNSEFSSFLIYIIAPMITILLSIIIGSITRKMTPKLYYIMTGGR